MKFKELMIFVFMIKYHCVLTDMQKSCLLTVAAEGYDIGLGHAMVAGKAMIECLVNRAVTSVRNCPHYYSLS